MKARAACVGASIAFAILTLTLACGEILDTVEDGPITDVADGATTSSEASSALPDGADGPQLDGGSCRNIPFLPAADSCLFGCAGGNSAGVFPMCNTDVGPFIGSFDLDPATAKDLRAGRVKSMRITFTNNPTCDGDASPDFCGDLPSQAGTLTAHVATNNWVEGADRTGYSGADGCRRSNGNGGIGWGKSGGAAGPGTAISSPADYGSVVGSVPIPAGAASLDLPIDPAGVQASWPIYVPVPADGGGGPAGSNRLTILAVSLTGRMVVGTRESKLVPPAKLTITICD